MVSGIHCGLGMCAPQIIGMLLFQANSVIVGTTRLVDLVVEPAEVLF